MLPCSASLGSPVSSQRTLILPRNLEGSKVYGLRRRARAGSVRTDLDRGPARGRYRRRFAASLPFVHGRCLYSRASVRLPNREAPVRARQRKDHAAANPCLGHACGRRRRRRGRLVVYPARAGGGCRSRAGPDGRAARVLSVRAAGLATHPPRASHATAPACDSRTRALSSWRQTNG